MVKRIPKPESKLAKKLKEKAIQRLAIERAKVFKKTGNMQVDTLWQSGYLKKVKKVRISAKEQNRLFGDFSCPQIVISKATKELEEKSNTQRNRKNKLDRFLY